MRGYSITRLLNLPEYKIMGIISETKERIHIRVEPYKRKKVKCGGCGAEHKKVNIAKKRLLCKTSR